MKTIVFAEDDLDLRETLGELLELEGYQVRLASTGREALQLVKRERPTILIMDLAMPDLDGAALRDELRKDPELASIPIIVMTGFSDVQMDGARVLRKPVQFDVLSKAIEEALAG